MRTCYSEQPWRIIQADPRFLGRQSRQPRRRDQQLPSEQGCPHLKHLRLVRGFAVLDTSIGASTTERLVTLLDNCVTYMHIADCP
jgi:hypothetical protein